MKRYLCFCALAVLFAAVSCETTGFGDKKPVPAEPVELTTRQAVKVAGDNTFAFKLFRATVATADEPENAFISPLSVTMALGMLYNGTSPEAADEMAAALGMPDFSADEINEYYRTMRRALLKIDPLTALSIANSIWSREGYSVKQPFIDTNESFYDAEVQSLDFDLPATLDAINSWCAKNTNNRIKTILDEIPSSAVMYLVNAVYFKSKWASQFDKKDTREENFTMADGSTKKVDMMNQTADVSIYYGSEDLECVELPYGNGAFGMMVILPPNGETLDKFIAGLGSDTYNDILAGMYGAEVRLKLPRFKQECKFSLVEPVANLGMQRIFSPGGNLNGIADDERLAVSDIKHKTFVEVNEEGTEAAAVTAVEFEVTSVGPGVPAEFFADRPFVYIIKEKSTGAILFIGRMDSPNS